MPVEPESDVRDTGQLRTPGRQGRGSDDRGELAAVSRRHHVPNREPMTVGRDQPDRAGLAFDQHTHQVRALGICSGGGQNLIERVRQIGRGQRRRGHGGLLRLRRGAESSSNGVGGFQVRLEPSEMRLHERVPCRLGQPDHALDLGERHVDPAEIADQRRGRDLALFVEPIAGRIVDPRGDEEASISIEAHRADRQLGHPSECADCHQFVHTATVASSVG